MFLILEDPTLGFGLTSIVKVYFIETVNTAFHSLSSQQVAAIGKVVICEQQLTRSPLSYQFEESICKSCGLSLLPTLSQGAVAAT